MFGFASNIFIWLLTTCGQKTIRAPIEQVVSTVKAYLRGFEARSRDRLEAAISDELRRITPSDARGWFQHCGYHRESGL